ncbi:MAG: VOC family protein [Chloroflexota bacterium]|nr:VOC family protein [Chloroflexota bacterium]
MAVVTKTQTEVILYVQDMNSEVRFYRDVLGLSIRYPQGLADYSVEMWVEFILGDTILALHGGAETQPDDLHEIVFWVDDVVQAREAIIAAGYDLNEIRTLEDDTSIAQGLDPAGHRYAIRAVK